MTGENWMANQLRKCRQIRGFTQAQLGRACGLPQPTISEFERGRLEPGPELRAKIAVALGLPEEVLFAKTEGSEES
jgi:transcriptional regulator with XRE-family HTH domain